MTSVDSGAASQDARPTMGRLRLWNALAAVVHAAQAGLMVVVATPTAWPLTRTRYQFDPATETIAPVAVRAGSVDLPLLVAGFLAVSAVAHTLIATVGYESYTASLRRERNPYRWYEYAVSASLMIVVIALLAGVWDLGTLAALFGLVAVMNLCGLVMERQNTPGDPTDWTAFVVGAIAGLVPWLVIALAIGGSVLAAAGEVPEFVIAIFLSVFLLFNCFAINMWLQYVQVGPWREYLFGERVYVALSLVAKSLLAWQVYFGTLTSPI